MANAAKKPEPLFQGDRARTKWGAEGLIIVFEGADAILRMDDGSRERIHILDLTKAAA